MFVINESAGGVGGYVGGTDRAHLLHCSEGYRPGTFLTS